MSYFSFLRFKIQFARKCVQIWSAQQKSVAAISLNRIIRNMMINYYSK